MLNFEEIFRHCIKKSLYEGYSREAVILSDSVRMLIGIATTGNNMDAPQKIKIELLYDPARPLPGTYPEEMNRIPKTYLHYHAHCNITDNSQDMGKA